MSLRLWLSIVLLLPGISGIARDVVLVSPSAAWHWRKGTAEASLPDRTAWRGSGFDDSTWEVGPAPLFYGEPLNGTELGDMQGGYSSVYLRTSFDVTNPEQLNLLRLRTLSDDGCVVWINGREVMRFNVPDGELRFNATAIGPFNEPLPTEIYDVKDFHSFLVPGRNVIAVHAFNVSLSSSTDFIIRVAVEAQIDDEPPLVAGSVPPPGARIRQLGSLTVSFDEGVSGVDASDLLINGHAATNLTAFGPDQYVFEFAPPSPGPISISWSPNAAIRDLSPGTNLFAGGGWSYIVDPNLPPPGVVLSEFMASNGGSLRDEDGEASDWIEIANTSEELVDLAGWTLSDAASNPKLWTFPSVSIPSRGFLIVFASGKDRRNPQAQLHTNFRLGREGGYLGLSRPGGAVASEFSPTYPPQFEDVSFGRLATDPLATGFFVTPTPGELNSEGGPGFSPEVRFSRVGGTFINPFTLTLSAEAGASVRYTLDGTLPTDRSARYTQPLNIAASTPVRARSFVPGLLPGPVSAEYYVRLAPSAVGVRSTLPLVLLESFGGGSVPPDGEYPAFLSIYEPRGGQASLTNAPDLRTRSRLNIRGSSTLGQPKQNYSVEFRDEREADLDLSPLGLPEDSDWVLYAPNNFEPILIHNPFIYRLSREIGRYAPRTRFVEVYASTYGGDLGSDHYVGIYVLMEKIKRHPDRVPIERLDDGQVTPPAVTGGYLLKVDRLDPGDSGLNAGGQTMGFVEPKEEEMDLPQRAPQRSYIQSYINGFRSALNAPNWQDPVLGWRAYVDVDSWIDHHILNVMAFNVDALRLSAYFYKPREEKLHFGPLWDFDRALNSTDGRDANPRIWRSGDGTDFFNYVWWGRMFRDPDFWQRWIDRYQELRRDSFSTNHLFSLVDSLTAEVRPAQPREVARWPGFTSPRGSYSSEITSLKNWLNRRLAFMDSNFLPTPVFNLASGHVEAGSMLELTGPAGATLYYTVDGTDPRAPGGAIANTARVYSGPIPVGHALDVRARARDDLHKNLTGTGNPPISSPWSGVIDGHFTTDSLAGPGDLEITEIQYRPAAPTPAELAANPLLTRAAFEFVELLNPGDIALDLHGLHFTSGIEFHFSTSSIPVLEPGARLLLVRHREGFVLRYGPNDRIAGSYGGGLAASGELLRIEDALGRVVAEAEYEDSWWPATDGLGFSLVRRDETRGIEPGFERDAWRSSVQPGGSPATLDPEPEAFSPVVVNEVVSNPVPPQLDGVELHNPGSIEADVGGWYLTDDRDVPMKYRIPEGTRIAPGGFLWIDETALASGGQGNTAFRFGSDGDAVWLFAGRGRALTGYAHGSDFGAAAVGVSFGRVVACDGREFFLPQVNPTPGSANLGPRVPEVVISEIQYRPPDILLGSDFLNDTALEFLEIANISDQPVALFDPVRTTNTWRLKDAVAYTFPTNQTLAPREVILVVNFDPLTNPQAASRFRRTYPGAAAIRWFGPYAGSLPNSSARIELAMPGVPPQGGGSGIVEVPAIVEDGVTYGDRVPWDAAADGGGSSLQRVEFTLAGDQPRVWVAAAPSPGTLPPAGLDQDGDGMPDAWEARACLDPNDPEDGGKDLDGDGASNASEYLAATDPRDPGDVLRWVHATGNVAGVELRFRAKAGVAYSIQVSEAAWGSPWTDLRQVEAASLDREITVTDGSAPDLRFYRIQVAASLGLGPDY